MLVNSSACPGKHGAPRLQALALFSRSGPLTDARDANSPGWSGDQPGLSGY
ncbi:hypothetical protein [Arthrobacter sp. StoSoilB22]|uniref:hypothetical protein n=1 Tax=Arthrobacter sp. StoSoilB22 TaxID=2830996 RepID=UPI001CC42C20|nr:hypothetical protein [Arthrobacter sp. StoSoilB22]